MAYVGGGAGSRTQNIPLLRRARLPIAPRRRYGAQDESCTRTAQILSLMPPAVGLLAHGRNSATRTHIFRFWRPTLYQLSYVPMARREGFEPS